MKRFVAFGVARLVLFLACLCSLADVPASKGQTANESEQDYSRLNAWSVFTEYSPDSSHMLLGVSQQRRLETVGGGYSRRLWQGRGMELHWAPDIRPLILESDPVVLGFETISGHRRVITFRQPPRVVTIRHNRFTLIPGNVLITQAYGRQWTYAGGAEPVAFQWNLRARHRLQPFVDVKGGFLYATRQIPVTATSQFNFTLRVGAGVEVYLQSRRSMQISYSWHHISNGYTGMTNPGVDSGMFRVGYSFGR